MGFFNRWNHNELEAIAKRDIARRGREQYGERYGENSSPENDAVTIDRGPASRNALSIGQTAEAMTQLRKRLCPACQIVMASMLAKSQTPPPAQPAPGPKLDVFNENLATRNNVLTNRPLSAAEQMGTGFNVENPARAALKKRDDAARRLTFDDAVATDDSIGVRRDPNAPVVQKAETKLVAAARAFGLKL